MRLLLLAALVLGSAAFASAAVFFEEKFDDTWESRWKKSTWKEKDGTAGEFVHTAGKFYGDAEADMGIQTTPDARFYTLYTELKKEFDNDGKDFVLQFSAKHEQKLDCGGGYIKVLPASSGSEMKDFGGNTPYSIMFGPDICGYSTKKVHVILTYKGTNYLVKKEIPCETDQLTHVYTLVLKPDNSYQVLVDLEEKAKGSLLEDWDIIPAKKIKDSSAKRPEDWDDRKEIPDPSDVKPEGHDDIPKTIVDSDAKKPDDWDEEEDGDWEPAEIPNPDYKGEWKQKMMENPDYQGVWEPPEIDNPDYFEDEKLYHFPTSKYLGFELWQVKAGTIFDNILLTDDLEYAREFAESTWGASKEAEKKMFDEAEAERLAKEEEERKKNMPEPTEDDDDDDEEDMDDEIEADEGMHDEL